MRTQGVREKPKGYWKKWENVEGEARVIIAKHGELLGAPALNKLGYSSFVLACFNYHNGMNDVRTRLGLPIIRRENGWTDESTDMLDQELSVITERLGHFPSCPELKKNGYGDLLSAIGRTGGVRKARQRAGITRRIRDEFSWTMEQQILDALRPLVYKLGRMPKKSEYITARLGGLYAAISDRFDIQQIAKKLCVGFQRVSPGGWSDWSLVEKELKEILQSESSFPTHSILIKRKRPSLSRAIVRYHGGYELVREKMGFNPITDNLLATNANDLAQIVIELGVPTDPFWSVMKARWVVRDLTAAIEEFRGTGSVERFRTLLNA